MNFERTRFNRWHNNDITYNERLKLGNLNTDFSHYKMSEINGNCNIQMLSFNFTYEDTKILIQCENSKEKSGALEPCRGPGHFNVEVKNIIKLDFSYCNLDFLPDCVRILPIKILNISNNNLSSVPNCIIRGLSLIEDLNLSNNKIQDFEEEPRCCCKLKILDLSSNLFSHLPLWIQKVDTINLREFYYSKNIIGNTSNAQYKTVASYNLQKAVLHSSMVRNVNIDFIKSIRTLKYLDLSNNIEKFRNVISPIENLFEKTAWYDTLEVLNLNGLDTAFLPDKISNIFNLKELYLNQNDLFYLPDTLGELRKLELIDLSQNHLSCLPPSFEKLTKLKILKLQHNQLCRIDEIYKLKKLDVLDLYHNELDGYDNSFEVPFLDLEQNIFDTSIIANYYEKRNLYRTQNAIFDRLDGPVMEDQAESEKSVSYCSSPSEIEDGEIEYQQPFDESESWDDTKVKSNPDVTSSDEEWNGHFQCPIPKKRPVVQFSPECYEIFQDSTDQQ